MKMADLQLLAGMLGVQLDYEDAGGKMRAAKRDALVEVLTARLGEAPTAASADRLKRRYWERGVEPVLVSWDGDGVSLELRLPRAVTASRAEWTLALDQGGSRSGTFDLASAALTAREGEYVSRRVDITESLPLGYHSLTVAVGAQTFEALVIAAPTEAHAPGMRTWGVFAPLYGAHSHRSWGTGDLGDLLAYTEWVDHSGGGVVATLPMLAAFPDEPSPYSPLSRLYWNELYLDIDRLPELRPEDVDHGAVANLQQLGAVDYQRVSSVKRPLLEKLAARFVGDEEYEYFARSARDYAEFRARIEQRDSARYHLYVQYRMAQQMRESAAAARKSGVGLYLDFPLGVNGGGYDVWKYREAFASGMSVGAPPDLFFTRGQNWGFPPLDPDAMRASRYEYFRACIANHAAHAGVLRIDHVMGLHRLFWIPEGRSAAEGIYVRYRDEELYAILTLESRRHRCAVVGEDLGTVPEYVPHMMAKHGIRRMYVAQYEAKPQDDPLGSPAAASVASLNTHDMPTFAAFWTARDVDDRVDQGLLTEKQAAGERKTREELRRRIVKGLVDRGVISLTSDPAKILEGLVATLAASDAEIVLVNLEDLWGELEPQNVPGLPEKSWKRKFRMSLEQVRDDARVRQVIGRLVAARPRER